MSDSHSPTRTPSHIFLIVIFRCLTTFSSRFNKNLKILFFLTKRSFIYQKPKQRSHGRSRKSSETSAQPPPRSQGARLARAKFVQTLSEDESSEQTNEKCHSADSARNNNKRKRLQTKYLLAERKISRPHLECAFETYIFFFFSVRRRCDMHVCQLRYCALH